MLTERLYPPTPRLSVWRDSRIPIPPMLPASRSRLSSGPRALNSASGFCFLDASIGGELASSTKSLGLQYISRRLIALP